jgi:hypothetical protein
MSHTTARAATGDPPYPTVVITRSNRQTSLRAVARSRWPIGERPESAQEA